MIHNKLVRDKIPDIIKAKGQNSSIHIASDEEYSQKLDEKLKEEVNEFLAGKNPEELIDIIEVVYTIANLYGIDEKTLDVKRQKKAEIKGEFTKRIILDES